MGYVDTQLFINGQWQPPVEGKTLPVLNPATGKEIGRVAHAGRGDLDHALAAAQKGFEAWRDATGIRILDGIGSTEMLHIFIGSPQDEIRPGSTGRPVPGYEARVVGDDGRELRAVAFETVDQQDDRALLGCRGVPHAYLLGLGRGLTKNARR